MMVKGPKSAFLIFCICTQLLNTAYALELRPSWSFFFPSETSITKEIRDVQAETSWDTKYSLRTGLEMLFKSEFAPMRYGIGVAIQGPQSTDDAQMVPRTIPAWFNISFEDNQKDIFAAPFASTRIGFIAPLSSAGEWWERPFNYLISFGVGCRFIDKVRLEVSYEYTSLEKSFEYKDTEFHLSSGKFGLQFSLDYEIIHEKVHRENRLFYIDDLND